MLLSFSGSMLLSFFGSFLLLSCVEHVSAEPKVVHMKTERKLRSTLHKRDFGDGNVAPLSLSDDKWFYYANTTIGTPPTTVLFDVDTGSSDTWMLSHALADDNNRNADIFCM